MDTDRLITSLGRDVPPVSRHALGRRIRIGMYVGGLGAIVLLIAMLGVRADLSHAIRGFPFWMKCTYTGSMGICAGIAVARLARPTPASLRMMWFLAVPILLLAGISVGELASTPSREWLAMWMSRSWARCPWLVLTLAMPIFVGLLWSFRKLAPMRARAAGAVAGLAAGAWAATIYCLYCPEVSALFVLTWYSLGIALAAAVGAVVGPRLMRW